MYILSKIICGAVDYAAPLEYYWDKCTEGGAQRGLILTARAVAVTEIFI